MPEYRSRTTTHGRNQAGARALWRATGMKDGDFDKPMIAVVNSFTQFVPGHVHLKDMGQLVAREIEKNGGVDLTSRPLGYRSQTIAVVLFLQSKFSIFIIFNPIAKILSVHDSVT